MAGEMGFGGFSGTYSGSFGSGSSSGGSSGASGSSGGGGSAMGAVAIGQAIMGATQAIYAGKVANAQAKYNAALMAAKSKMIEFQKGITNERYNRGRGQFISTSMNRVAGAGIMPQGSAMAVLLDSVTQINIDKTISMYNLEMQKIYTDSAEQMYKNEGKAAMDAAKVNAFSSILNSAGNYGLYKYGGK